MIQVVEYEKFSSRTYGLGQDGAKDIRKIVRVAALFVKESSLYKSLVKDDYARLRQVTLDLGAPNEIYEHLKGALKNNDFLTHKELVSLKGSKDYASGLVRAIYPGQKKLVIREWPASNYVSLAVSMGLLDIDYAKDAYYITELGIKAVKLDESNDESNDEAIKTFLLERLYEYPYAAWLIRLLNENPSKKYSKFELGDNFGFIDEPGFISLPKEMYVEGILEAKAMGDKEAAKKIKSNFESTSDKYMRWLAGVLAEFKLVKQETESITREMGGKTVKASYPVYKLTTKGRQALNIVNGGSSHARSKKRVRWEYLAPKVENADRRKTARALMLKYLSESKSGLTAAELSEKINEVEPSIQSYPEQVQDDIKGLNRIGIEIATKSNGKFILKEELYDFVIPVKKNHTFGISEADKIKRVIKPRLKNVDHRYLQAIDIAFKKSTTNQENTLLEVLSTELFTKEMNYTGVKLGGSNKPDGFAYDDHDGWILDSKAYHNGYAVTRHNTDAMARYISQYRNRNDSSTWWKNLPDDLESTQFMYISSKFIGKYQEQLKDFEVANSMQGSTMAIGRLILLAERVKSGKLDHKGFKEEALRMDHVKFDDYIEADQLFS